MPRFLERLSGRIYTLGVFTSKIFILLKHVIWITSQCLTESYQHSGPGVYILPLSVSRKQGIIQDFMKFEVSLFENSPLLSYFEANFLEFWPIFR